MNYQNYQNTICLSGEKLEKMYSLQMELLEHYIPNTPGMPNFPININDRAGQRFMKEYTGHMIEELSEAFEMHLLYSNAVGSNESDYNKYLQAFNEEIGDALHFMVELLIYANITPASIMGYYENILKEKNLFDVFYFDEDPLRTGMAFASFINTDGQALSFGSFGRCFMGSKGQETNDPFLKAGFKASPEYHETHQVFLWNITHKLNQACNLLKKKPWAKDGDRETTARQFQFAMVDAWVVFTQYLDFLGYTDQLIYQVYHKVNHKNQERIKNNY